MVKILCRRELYARTYYTSYIYQNVEKQTAIRVEVSQFQKEVHFQITPKTPHFGTQKYPSTRTDEAWVGEQKGNNTNTSHIISFKKKGTRRLATIPYQ